MGAADTRASILAGRTAVITGAGGGIGRGIAGAMARRGCHLALVDRSPAGLVETERLVAAIGRRVSRHVVDVTDAAAVAALPDQVRAIHGGVDLLINNAGATLEGRLDELDWDAMERLLAVNFWGVVRMIRAFLPLLRASDRPRLVNIVSVYGMIGAPHGSIYAASKFAVRGLSQSLQVELLADRIGVLVVYPGAVATAIVDDAGERPDLPGAAKASALGFGAYRPLSPSAAGERIAAGIERDRPRIVLGNDAHMIAWAERIWPVHHWKWLARALRHIARFNRRFDPQLRSR